MEDKYLPLGTVVILYDKQFPLMITGFKTVNMGTGNTFDYAGCIYPFGLIDEKGTILFNHNKIAKVLFTGYKSENSDKYNERLKNDVTNFAVEQFFIEPIHKEEQSESEN